MNVSRPPATAGEAAALERCRRLVEPALREAVAGLHPWSSRMAGFALGWSDADGRPQTGDGGKGVRPAVVLLAAEAVGADAADALPGAVAVELVHAFSLAHDDIIDHDERRRHRETLWKAYGPGPALLTGDALLALAVAQLATVPEAMRLLSAALTELVHGQSADMAFENRPWRGPHAVTVEEYTRMAAGKTGGLLGAAAALGVTLGGAPPEAAEAMWRMGCDLGVAFQIADDVLGIWGDPAVTGKPVHSDLRREKKTLPVLCALAAGGTAARELSAVLAAGLEDEDAVRAAARLVEEAGGRAAGALAARHLSAALHLLDAHLPQAADLRALCESLVHRTR